MNLLKLLTTAGVPEALHAQAIACLREAYRTGTPTFESRRAKP